MVKAESNLRSCEEMRAYYLETTLVQGCSVENVGSLEIEKSVESGDGIQTGDCCLAG